MNPAITLNNLEFGWTADKKIISIQHFSLAKGDQLLIFGASGCGKSSLLNLITGVNRANRGCIHIYDTDTTQLYSSKMDKFRAREFGIIFQTFNLIPYLTIIENIQLRSQLAGKKVTQQEITDLLSKLQLDAYQHSRCSQLSLGQQQRVAIARALITQPGIIIADEPTSSLDPNNKQLFMKLLMEECSSRGNTLVMVSHDPELQTWFPQVREFAEINSL